MNRLVQWMTQSFAPRLHRVTNNAWVGGVQDAMLRIVPFVLVGSVMTLVALIPGASRIPHIAELNSFTFGMIGLFGSFLITYFVLERRERRGVSVIAGLASVAVYLMLLKPVSADGQITFTFERFGAIGLFAAIIGGLMVALITDLFSRLNLFADSAMPSFVVNWFNSLLPILISLVLAWLCTYTFDLDIFAGIVTLFSPLNLIGQSFIGFVLICFIHGFMYSFGISPWALSAITYPIWFTGIQANAQAVTAGGAATNIDTQEVFFSGFIAFGGIGATLTLTLMMSFLAKSQQFKAIGRAGLVPSIFNINEPIVFGAPIAFNPMLMIPMWINALVLPILTYGALSWGLAKIPDAVFGLWYIPFPFQTAFVSDWRGVILAIVLIVITAIVWYPFFRAQDRQLLRAERDESDGAMAVAGGAA